MVNILDFVGHILTVSTPRQSIKDWVGLRSNKSVDESGQLTWRSWSADLSA